VQTSFTRTLATGHSKGPMDYVKQGVDQLGQAAEKVKEAVSSATSSVVDAVKGDSHTSKCIVLVQSPGDIFHYLFRQKNRRCQRTRFVILLNTNGIGDALSVCFLNHSGHQAANNFRNATEEAKNRSGYSSGDQSPSSNRKDSASSTSSGAYGSTASSHTSGQTATDKIKEKASEFAEQAKSTVSLAEPVHPYVNHSVVAGFS
jgi:hypothetical protein